MLAFRMFCDGRAAAAARAPLNRYLASLQVNFNTIAVGEAEASMRLFAEKVMPGFR